MRNRLFPNYKTIGKLILLMVVLAAILSTVPAGAAETLQKHAKPQTTEKHPKKYPPYPDVWGYRFPMSERFRSSQIKVHKILNGDYAITYLIDISKKDSPPEWRLEGIDFFSGKKVESKDLKKLEEDRNIYGKTVSQNGIRIENRMSWEQGQECFSCCPDYSKYPITKYTPYRTNEQLSIVYFNDEPIRQFYVEPFEKCIGKGSWQRFKDKFYYQQVFEVFPWFVPLKDGTFLIYDSLGNFIIRFDKGFKSKSELLNRNVFVVNTADIRTLERRLLEIDIFNRQTYDNVVAVYIKALKKGIQREVALEEALDSIKDYRRGLKGRDSDRFYVFREGDLNYFQNGVTINDDFANKAIGIWGDFGKKPFEGNGYELHEIPGPEMWEFEGKKIPVKYFLGGWFYFHPFLFGKKYFISMNDWQGDLPKKWEVVLSCAPENQLKDTCYFIKVCGRNDRQKGGK